ncbi:unnamed protein product [Prorocentrum cordatum]|uniref:Limiting CO2-inducible protein B/C beta carbonyic anhydrase domain-containing protein n=1 Tax=Prorocentrum cordatum TaxID=2364126 RepID=A0ABN9PV52_9DINO|nr:unnamed protein product [Polarella glacialis]
MTTLRQDSWVVLRQWLLAVRLVPLWWQVGWDNLCSCPGDRPQLLASATPVAQPAPRVAAGDGADEAFRCQPAGREVEETAQDRVFHWLGKSPEYGSPCFTAMQRHFPNALPSKVVHNRSRAVLEMQYGFRPETTLLGSSFCPDEINNEDRDLPTVMRQYYGDIFPMGGIGGAPYVGETGFAAFSSHVADNGDIIVVFGPHVGISVEGEVGKYLRQGQSGNSSACGAVIGAYNACLCGGGGNPEMDEADMQMSEIKQEFAAHAEKLSKAEDPMAACRPGI